MPACSAITGITGTIPTRPKPEFSDYYSRCYRKGLFRCLAQLDSHSAFLLGSCLHICKHCSGAICPLSLLTAVYSFIFQL